MTHIFNSKKKNNKNIKRKHLKENNTFPYGDHESLLPLAGLPLVLPLAEKVTHEKGEYKIYLVRDPLLVLFGVKVVNFLLRGTLQHNNLIIPYERIHISLVIP